MNIPIGQQNAFPFFYQGPTTGPEVYYGITIRDYFATQALLGLVTYGDIPDSKKVVADVAYEYADAMLEARKNI